MLRSYKISFPTFALLFCSGYKMCWRNICQMFIVENGAFLDANMPLRNDLSWSIYIPFTLGTAQKKYPIYIMDTGYKLNSHFTVSELSISQAVLPLPQLSTSRYCSSCCGRDQEEGSKLYHKFYSCARMIVKSIKRLDSVNRWKCERNLRETMNGLVLLDNR